MKICLATAKYQERPTTIHNTLTSELRALSIHTSYKKTKQSAYNPKWFYSTQPSPPTHTKTLPNYTLTNHLTSSPDSDHVSRYVHRYPQHVQPYHIRGLLYALPSDCSIQQLYFHSHRQVQIHSSFQDVHGRTVIGLEEDKGKLRSTCKCILVNVAYTCQFRETVKVA